jgi:superfamily II DNA helicase RecQ
MGAGHLPTAPILLSQPTGGGKSMVCDAYACSAPGVTLNFAPLLSLNADQNEKFVAKCIDPNCFSVHLDTYKDFQERQALCDLIL